MTIYDLITSDEIVAYWDLMTQDRAPFMGEELFPADKKIGIDLKWLKGAYGVPVVLKPSAFDAAAIPRPRIGFEKLSTEMPFFKESMYIDEELRQELNKVIESGNQVYVDAVVGRIFNDEIELIESAAVQRERMRMSMLTTGTIVMEGNGQVLEYDYHMPSEHKVTVTKSWSDPAADILGDLRAGIELISNDTGATIERAVCSSKVFGYMRKNEEIRQSINIVTDGRGFISDSAIKQFVLDNFGISIAVNDKKVVVEDGTTQRYVPEDVIVLFPAGRLGTTWFGTTPEESDLMASNAANVSITDVGVAVTTMHKADPVQVETKVTQICLPDFPTADQVYILDVEV